MNLSLPLFLPIDQTDFNCFLKFQDINKAIDISSNGNDGEQLLLMTSSDENSTMKQGQNCSSRIVSTATSPIGEEDREQLNNTEKEERRKIASKVLGKQG